MKSSTLSHLYTKKTCFIVCEFPLYFTSNNTVILFIKIICMSLGLSLLSKLYPTYILHNISEWHPC